MIEMNEQCKNVEILFAGEFYNVFDCTVHLNLLW